MTRTKAAAVKAPAKPPAAPTPAKRPVKAVPPAAPAPAKRPVAPVAPKPEPTAKPPTKPRAEHIVGEVEFRPVDSVTPNNWNPNRMSEFTFQSLVAGLKEDGWLASDSMLVWGTDENGAPQNIIINGEHRWKAAKELGFELAPMVVLNGITARAAKKLTIKLDNKRGKFDPSALGQLVRELTGDVEDPLLGLSLGFTDDEMTDMLSNGSIVPPPPGSSAYQEQYGVIVMCRNETHQKEIFDRLQAEGLECKVVVT